MNQFQTLLMLLLSLASACAETPAQKETHLAAATQDSLPVSSQIIRHQGLEFLCFEFEFQNHSLSIVNQAEDQQILSFADFADSTILYTGNAGMYEKSRLAKGLLISDGHLASSLDTATSGYGNFYLQPNGAFWMDSTGQAHISTTREMMGILQTDSISQATQSGPIMIQDSVINPLFGVNSPNRRTRNAVAINANGKLLFVQSLEEVTFYELSSFLRSRGCKDALYLDGVVSRSWHRDLEPHGFGAGGEVGPLVVVREIP